MRNRVARVAGLLYLLAIVVGWFTLRYVPGKLIVLDDASATAHNIVANEFLFRLGMVGDLLTGAVWLAVVLSLHELLKDVEPTLAKLMVIFGAFMQVPLYFVNVVNYVAALLLVSRTPFLSVFPAAQRDAIAMLFLRLHHYELLASFVFAGLWLLPFGMLVYRSGFLPRILGIWLVLDCFAWLAISVCGFLTPEYAAIVDTVTFPLTFAEVAITLWLLVIGTKAS
jgi:hypothetical protein